MKYNVRLYSDGRPSKYGNLSNLNLEDTIEELIYYDAISKVYTEELRKRLEDIKDYITFGSRWSEIEVRKV